MVNKKNKKKVLIVGITFGLILILLAVQQMSFVGTSYQGTVMCNKETGCTNADLNKCNQNIANLESNQGWVCSSGCSIYCSDTSEMERRNSDYENKCNVFTGGGALVEAKARCSIIEPKSHDKTVCSDGSDHTFTSKSGYPSTKQWEDWDVYYMNEIDQLEEKAGNCGYACRQDSDKVAKCVASPTSSNNYVSKDHKGCYIFSGRYEVWWFDSENDLNARIEVCDGTCDNGECKPQVPLDNPSDSGLIDPEDCFFGACEEGITMTCTDGTEIMAYDCQDGCSVPTQELCPNGDRPVTSSCELYQKANLDGSCSFDIKQFQYVEAYTSFYEDYRNGVLITTGGIIIFISLVIGGVIWKKKGRGL